MWFMERRALEELAQARKSGYVFSAEERAQFAAAFTTSSDRRGPRILSVAGDTAEIRIEGVLTPKPDIWAYFFGGGNTTYADIMSALAIAGADPSIKKAIIHAHSPGGTVHGLFETLAAIEAFPKPLSSRVTYACSACYAIVAKAGKIQAMHPAVEVGSIGVAVSYTKWADIEYIDITSTEAPDKRPDPTTEEGRAVIRRQLDAIHEIFVDAIARGRSESTGRRFTVEDVNRDFGRGAVLIAGDAKKRGMIDQVLSRSGVATADVAEHDPESPGAKEPAAGVAAAASEAPTAQEKTTSPEATPAVVPEETTSAETEPTSVTDQQEPTDSAPATHGGAQAERRPMDLKTLEKEHPELYQAAVQVGVEQERKRVRAHVKMGKSHNALDVTFAAIESGVSVSDEECLADYLSAGRNASDAAARENETRQAAAVVEGAPSGSTQLSDVDKVAAELDRLYGDEDAA